MRFMVIVKATKDSEAGKMPSEEMLAAMAKFNEEMVKAGIMLDGDGPAAELQGRAHPLLRRQAHRHRRAVCRDQGADRRLLDHPGEVEGRGDRMDEALPQPYNEDGEIEIRQFFELEDFGASPAVEHHRQLGEQMAKK